MKVIGEIEHPKMGIFLFYMNQKYIIKFEMYGMEQIYKLSELDYIIPDVEAIKKAITPEFTEKVLAQFTAMQALQSELAKDF